MKDIRYREVGFMLSQLRIAVKGFSQILVGECQSLLL